VHDERIPVSSFHRIRRGFHVKVRRLARKMTGGHPYEVYHSMPGMCNDFMLSFLVKREEQVAMDE
jgi:hypothetical protein